MTLDRLLELGDAVGDICEGMKARRINFTHRYRTAGSGADAFFTMRHGDFNLHFICDCLERLAVELPGVTGWFINGYDFTDGPEEVQAAVASLPDSFYESAIARAHEEDALRALET